MTFTPEQEANAAILHDYGELVVLPLLKDEGTWVAPATAPLPAKLIERELERLSKSNAYDRQTIMFRSEDGWHVTLSPRGIEWERCECF